MKAAPQGCHALLAIEQVFVASLHWVWCADHLPAHETLLVPDLKYPQRTRWKSLQNCLEQARNVLVSPRLETLESRQANLPGSDAVELLRQ